MESYNGYTVGLYINDTTFSMSPSTFSFKISDNIHNAFPLLDLVFDDSTGLFLEMGDFTQGIPINIKLGFERLSTLLDVCFVCVRKDTILPSKLSSGLGGKLNVKGLHKSFFENRKAFNIAIKDTTVADAVKILFSNEKSIVVDSTKGKTQVYAFDCPYALVRDALLPQATDGKLFPFLFFRDLTNMLHFQSLFSLESAIPTTKLFFGGINAEENIMDTLNVFLPFCEGLETVLPKLNVDCKFMNSDLDFQSVKGAIADNAKGLIPVIDGCTAHHEECAGRQFNPDVSYNEIVKGIMANSMRGGYFIDKALCSLPLHIELTAGKIVQLEVAVASADGKNELSQTYSGNYLIEQSTHIWDGVKKQASTELVLCRSSVVPRSDSILIDRAYKG